MNTYGEWPRSEILNVDLLRLFQHGDFYDCTFQLSSQQTGETKDVKCHKLILSASSCVFAKMFYGNFKEAHLAPDDPIPLRDVTPEVFECAMSVLYSQEQKFNSVKLAMDVYKFAHEMQMPSVMHAVNQFFKTISTSDALAVIDFCIQMDNKEGLKICFEGLNFVEALRTDAWLKVSESVVEKVLQLDLAGSEVVAAVLKWGRAQVKAADAKDKSEMGKLMRLKMNSCLKFIKWSQFDNKQFSELCQGDWGLVLSAEEKSKIHECIALGKGALAVPQKLGQADEKFFTMELPHLVVSGNPIIFENLESHITFSSQFTLKVDQECQFLGLGYYPVGDFILYGGYGGNLNPSMMKVAVKKTGNVLSTCHRPVNSCGSFELDSKLILKAGVEYSIRFQFPTINHEPKKITTYVVFEPYHQPGKIVIHNDAGDICATLSSTFEGVKVNALYFGRC